MARADADNRAAARESSAFLRGHTYAAEAMIRAHDDLLPLLVLLIERERANGAERLADLDHERVLAVMAEVRHVRECAGAESLTLFDIERTIAAER